MERVRTIEQFHEWWAGVDISNFQKAELIDTPGEYLTVYRYKGEEDPILYTASRIVRVLDVPRVTRAKIAGQPRHSFADYRVIPDELRLAWLEWQGFCIEVLQLRSDAYQHVSRSQLNGGRKLHELTIEQLQQLIEMLG